MKKIIVIASIILIGVGGPDVIAAQVPNLTLDECVALALSENGAVRAASIGAEISKTRTGSAFNPAKTSISLSQDVTDGGNMENGVTFSQEFDFPTVYVARHKMLKAEAELSALQSAVKRSEIVRDITTAYCELSSGLQQLDILLEQDSIYTRFLEIATARFKQGETSRLELMNAERIVAENRIELNRVKTSIRSVQEKMAALLGSETLLFPSEYPILPMPVMEMERSFAGTLFARESSAAIKLSERNLALAKAEFLPDISVAATVQALIKGINPYHIDRQRFEKGNFMGFEVGVSIPLFFGAQRAKARVASLEVDMARAERSYREASQRAEYSSLMAQVADADHTWSYYRDTALAQANELCRIAKVSYELGEIDYMEYIQNLETGVSVRLKCVDALLQRNISIAKFNFITSEQ